MQVPAIEPLEQKRRRYGGERDDNQQCGIQLAIQDALAETELRKDQTHLAARDHGKADRDLIAERFVDEEARRELADEGCDQQRPGQAPYESRAPVHLA